MFILVSNKRYFRVNEFIRDKDKKFNLLLEIVIFVRFCMYYIIYLFK